MVERQNTYDSADTGDYGEVPPGINSMPGVVGLGHIKDSERLLGNPEELEKSHPNIHGFISEVQSVGKKVVATVDAHKGTTLIVGTAVAIGTVAAGGIVIKEYAKRRK
jgi:hypothetical protein